MEVGDIVECRLSSDLRYIGIVYQSSFDGGLHVFYYSTYNLRYYNDLNNIGMYKPYSEEAILNLEYLDILDTLERGATIREKSPEWYSISFTSVQNIKHAIAIARGKVIY